MNNKDREFLKALVNNLDGSGYKPPFEFTQRRIRLEIQKYYEYSTEKSVVSKLRLLHSEGLIDIQGMTFTLTETAIKIGRE